MPISETPSPSTANTLNGNGRPDQQAARWNGRFSITITLVTAISLLTLISVGGVLGVGVWLAQKNTFALLSDNAHQGVTAAVNRIEQHLKPAEYQAMFLAEQISSGRIDAKDHKRLGDMFTGALAAAPQIDSVIYIDSAMQAYLVANDGRHGNVIERTFDYSRDPEILKRMAAVVPGPNWGTPIWRDSTKRTYINIVVPVSFVAHPVPWTQVCLTRRA